MFDDQNQPQSNPQVPSNLPFGQPQSPFVSPPPVMQQAMPQAQPIATQSQPTNFSQSIAPVADMFAETDPLAGGRANPAGYPGTTYNSQAGVPGYPPAGSAMTDDLFGRRSFPWGKVVTIIIIVLVVVVGIGSIYYGYQYFSSGNTTKVTGTPVTTTPTVPAATANTSAELAPLATSTEVTPAVTEDNKDSDGDGLTDQEEKVLGTKIDVADTDADGLTDWAEVKIYKTNPLNPDTDGDTYKDGQEVINGYDPLLPGSARLYEVPKATSTN